MQKETTKDLLKLPKTSTIIFGAQIFNTVFRQIMIQKLLTAIRPRPLFRRTPLYAHILADCNVTITYSVVQS